MDRSNLVWLDLCSGLGGASQPALDRGWKVIRVDIDPRFKPDIVADVRHLPFKPFHVDVLWASPPCQAFSKAGLPKSWACNRNYAETPSTEIAEACRRLARLLDCFWVIENVASSRKFLTPMLGQVRAQTGGHIFWSNMPLIIPQANGHKWRLPPSPDRAALRAKIPYEIGNSICAAVERRMEEEDESVSGADVGSTE